MVKHRLLDTCPQIFPYLGDERAFGLGVCLQKGKKACLISRLVGGLEWAISMSEKRNMPIRMDNMRNNTGMLKHIGRSFFDPTSMADSDFPRRLGLFHLLHRYVPLLTRRDEHVGETSTRVALTYVRGFVAVECHTRAVDRQREVRLQFTFTGCFRLDSSQRRILALLFAFVATSFAH